MNRVLVIGYGSAGHRHAAHLSEHYGFDIWSYDPDPSTGASCSSQLERLVRQPFLFAVIASPPAYHAEQIEMCLDQGMRVVCEKPLFAEAAEIDKCASNYLGGVAVTYNYRYHPGLLDFRATFVQQPTSSQWYLKCLQYRERMPEWGFVLDHVSHDVDILRFMSGQELQVERSEYIEDRNRRLITVKGRMSEDDTPFTIHEEISKNRTPRMAQLNTPWGWVDINPDPAMFFNMWDAFMTCIKGNFEPYPNLWNAYATQKTLDQITEKMSYWSVPA